MRKREEGGEDEWERATAAARGIPETNKGDDNNARDNGDDEDDEWTHEIASA
jgi:hypothetical protein